MTLSNDSRAIVASATAAAAGIGERLEELADTDEFREFLHREFPREASVWDDAAIDRRRFLQLMAASLALAGLQRLQQSRRGKDPALRARTRANGARQAAALRHRDADGRKLDRACW